MQTDLFGSVSLSSSQSTSAPRTDFLERHRFSVRLDQALVGFISLLVIYVMIFSFGVEKGKRFALAELKAERQKHERSLEELRDKIFSAQPVTQAVVTAGTVTSSAVSAEAVVPATTSTPVLPTAKTESGTTIKAAVAEVVDATRPAGKYTIQIATLNTKTQAEKELKRLSSTGLTAFSIPSGKYEQICVNGFETKELANKALKSLKVKGSIPADAYVRPISKIKA